MAKSLNILPEKLKISLKADRAVLLTCFGIALIFWFFIKLSKTYTEDFSFQLEYALQEDLAFVEMPPAKLRTTIEGRGWDLLYLSVFGNAKILTFPVTETGTLSINRTAILNTLSIWLDNPLFKIQSLSIDQLNLKLETLAKKKVQVRVAGNIQTAPNYALTGSINISPDSVFLIGAPSILELFDTWETTDIKVENLRGTWQEVVDLKKPADETLTIRPVTVDVEIPVEAITEKRLFVPITALNPPSDSFTIFPKQVQLTFTVGVGEYQNIEKDSFEAVIDYSRVKEGERQGGLPINIRKMPESINLINYSPKTAEILVILNQLPEEESR
jgi:hypothetical protein